MRALLLVAVSITSQVAAQDQSNQIAALLNKVEASKPLAISQAKEAFENAKADLLQARLLRTKEKAGKVAAADKQLKAAKDHLAALERGEELPLPKLPDKLDVSMIGHLRNMAGAVVTVLERDACVIHWPGGFVVLKGPRTDNLPADKSIDFPPAMHVAGYAEYESARWGKQRILVLEAVDVEALRRAWKAKER